MKYSGLPLDDLIEEDKLNEENIKFILYQCLLLFEQMEKLNITHGDIKPNNIIIDPKSLQVTVIDWGFVDVTPQFSRNTSVTEGFHSPEVFLDGIHNPLTDIFSLGMTFLYYYTRQNSYREALEHYYKYKRQSSKLNQIKNQEMKQIISDMIQIEFKNRKPASVLIKNSLFDQFRNGRPHKPLNSFQFRIREVEEVDTEYISYHPDLTLKMREILFDWLYDVCKKYRNLSTYNLACYLVDVYLSKSASVSRSRLQVVGASCAYIATTLMVEPFREVEDYTYVCDRAYTNIEMMEMVLNILKELNFIVFKPRFDHSLENPDYKIIRILMLDRNGIGQSEQFYLNLYKKIEQDPENVDKYVNIEIKRLITRLSLI